MFKKGQRVDIHQGTQRVLGIVDGIELEVSEKTQKPEVVYHIHGKVIHDDGSIDLGTVVVKEDVAAMALEVLLEVLEEHQWMADTFITHHQAEQDPARDLFLLLNTSIFGSV